MGCGHCCAIGLSAPVITTSKKGYAPVYARENITSMYDAYHSLGGMESLRTWSKQTMELPYEKGGESPFEQSR